MPLPMHEGLHSRSRVLPAPSSVPATLTESFVWPDMPWNNSSNSYSGVTDFSSWQGTQVTESESHPDWPRRHRANKASGDVGGPFFTKKTWCASKGARQDLSGMFIYGPYRQEATYSGAVLPMHPSLMPLPSISPSTNNALEALGTVAIERSKPTNSVADATVFLTELYREGIPNMIGSSLEGWAKGTQKARHASSEELLNYEFGWKPIANDVKKFLNAVRRSDQVLAQYERDSGNIVRRRYEFPPESTVENTLLTGKSPYIELSTTALYNSADRKSVV